MKFRLSLDLPLAKREASRRGLRLGLAKLLVCAEEEKDFGSLVLLLLEQWRPPGSKILICSENDFKDLSLILRELPGIELATEGDSAAILDDALSAVALLESWPAEAHIVFFGDKATLAKVGPAAHRPFRFLSLGTSLGYQGSYLEKIGVADPFLFLSHGHPSVEVIGSKAAVLEAFDAVRHLLSDNDANLGSEF